MAREYVIRCEHTAGSVWTPVGLYAIDGEDPRVTRCRDCVWHYDGCPMPLVTDDTDFCSFGIPREGDR